MFSGVSLDDVGKKKKDSKKTSDMNLTLDDLISSEKQQRRNKGRRRGGRRDNYRREDFGNNSRLWEGYGKSQYNGQWDTEAEKEAKQRRRNPRRRRDRSRSYSPEDEAFDKLPKDQKINMSLDDFMNRRERRKARTNIIPRSKRIRRQMDATGMQDSDSDIEDLSKCSGLLVILRGMPGSGKSTFARKIVDYYLPENVSICGVDNHYYTSGKADIGVYNTEISEQEVKKRCLKDLRQKMDARMQMILLDGCGVSRDDYRDARLLAKSRKYGVKVMHVKTASPRPNDEKVHLLDILESDFQADTRDAVVEHNFEPWTRKAIEGHVDVDLPEDTEMGDTEEEEISGKCAYVTLVMRGTSYVLGAINLAHSLRLAGTKHDIVCMITEEVKELKPALEVVFDRVVFVDYIKCLCREMITSRQREKYSEWISDSFTKWNCLKFTEYSKVLFLDADVVVLDNLDSLFNLQAPAGTFSSPWARGKSSVLNDHYKGPKELFGHGKKISWTSIEQGLNNHGFVCPATCVLLEPNDHAFHAYTNMLKSRVANNGQYGWGDCFSGFDEQSIVELYWKEFQRERHQWTHIDQTYNFIPWHFKWIEGTPKVIHYFGKNVWEMTRIEWADVRVWWNMFESLFRGGYYNEEQRGVLSKALTDEQKEVIKNRPEAKCFWCESLKKDANHETVDGGTGRVTCPELLKCLPVIDTYSTKAEVVSKPGAIDYGF